MKTLLLTFFILSSSIVVAQQNASHTEVQNTVRKLFEALSNRDAEAVRAVCAPDAEFYESGEVWGLDSLVMYTEKLKRIRDFKRVNTLDFLKTNVEKDVAWVTYRNRADVSGDGTGITVKWLETVVMVRRRNTWVIKALHSTLLDRR